MKTPFFLLIVSIVIQAELGFAEPTSAGVVQYHNANRLRTETGKAATTVQKALDSLSLSVSQIITGPNARKSSWSGSVSDVFAGTFRKSAITVTFKPTDATSGTWTSEPFDVFSPSDLFAGNQGGLFPYGEQGTWKGRYKIIGSLILASELVSPNNEMLAVGRTSIASVNGTNLQLVDTSTVPSTITALHKN